MTQPLEGILVVALEQAVAAPFCSSRLADAGARVIKIERDVGDFARGYDTVVKGEASYFVWVNRGKESIQLNIKDAHDAALLQRILANTDVFIQNLAPGAAARAGFDSQELRQKYPKLITCDISGYGEEGSYRDMKAYDLLVQAESGLLAVSGAPGDYGRIGVSVCDIAAGMNALIGIQQALLQRMQSGQGSSVKVSLFDGAADWMSVPLLHQDYSGKAPGRVGLKHPSIAPYGGFQTADGETLVISIQNEREWASFCQNILGMTELATNPRFNNNNKRVAHRSELDAMISEAFGNLDRSELEQRLSQARIAYGFVNSVATLSEHAQIRRWPVTLPDGETANLVAPPMQMESDPGTFKPVPALGQHTGAIRQEFAADD